MEGNKLKFFQKAGHLSALISLKSTGTIQTICGHSIGKIRLCSSCAKCLAKTYGLSLCTRTTL